MSSSITFAFQHLADYPEVLAKVREEQTRIRGSAETPITLDLMDNMKYTEATVKEVLRHRPPVIMVPYLVKKNFPLTEDYTVPKGTMLMYVCASSPPPFLLFPPWSFPRATFPSRRADPPSRLRSPSFWNALHDPAVYPDPEEFIPERWLPGGTNFGPEDSKNWLVFGAGAHRCIAQSYVSLFFFFLRRTVADKTIWGE